jgi:hypothetical protein
MDRFEATLVQRDVLADKTAQTVDDSRVGNGFWRINVSVDFRACAGKVEYGLTLLRIDRYLEPDRASIIHEILCAKILAFKTLVDVFE